MTDTFLIILILLTIKILHNQRRITKLIKAGSSVINISALDSLVARLRNAVASISEIFEPPMK